MVAFIIPSVLMPLIVIATIIIIVFAVAKNKNSSESNSNNTVNTKDLNTNTQNSGSEYVCAYCGKDKAPNSKKCLSCGSSNFIKKEKSKKENSD